MKKLGIVLVGALWALTAQANNYVGDYAPGSSIRCSFGTVQPSTGASFALAGTPAVSIYKDGGTTESTSGVTLTASLDSRTGLNHVVVTTASDGSFYSAGSYFDAVITTGTVDSVSVVGQPVCSFSLNKTGNAALNQLLGLSTTGNCASAGAWGIKAMGTASAYTSGTPSVTLHSDCTDGLAKAGETIFVRGSGGATYWQSALVVSSSGDVVTIDQAFATAPTTAFDFILFASPDGAREFTANEVIAAKAILGIGNDNATPQDPSTGILDTTRDRVVAGIPNATPGAAGGVLIAGNNAATTFTGTNASGSTPATAGLTLVGGAASTTGGGVSAPGLSSTGGAGAASTNGAAAGIVSTGGGTTTVSGGNGMTLTGTGNLNGLATAGAGSGHGNLNTGGATGSGTRNVGGSTSGAGLANVGTAGNSAGQSNAGQGSAAGQLNTGGATGQGSRNVGGSTSGEGFAAVSSAGNSDGALFNGQGTGDGAQFTSGAGATGNGAQFTAASTNGNGIGLTAAGSGTTMTITPANATQIGGQTASASGTITFPAATLASTTNITSATGVTVATNNDKTGYSLSVAPPTAEEIAAELLTTNVGSRPFACLLLELESYAFGEWSRVSNVVTYRSPDGDGIEVELTLAGDNLSRTMVTVTCP